ncbi:MAG: VanZ family protein [Alphaproteobacteria bacterium]|nr:VanZ family protein [Alphaproteobacteria bacterium]MDP6812261.1 VanZ family protein [Alphaproteobacteria bacterium]
MPRLLVALTLAVLTVGLFAGVQRFDVAEPQLLNNGDFAAAFAGWEVLGEETATTIEQGTLTIIAPDNRATRGVRQTIERSPAMQHLMLSAAIRHESVTKGDRPWQAMRLLLVPRDKTGRKMWELPHVAAQTAGDAGWHSVGTVFRFGSQVASMEVSAVLNQVAGTYQLRDLTLQVLTERPVFTAGRYLVTGLCLVALPWLLWPLLTAGRRRHWRAAVALMAVVILVGTQLPHSVKNLGRDVIEELVELWPDAPAPASSPKAGPGPEQKRAARNIAIGEAWWAGHGVGHVALFALLAGLTAGTWRRRPWWLLAGYLVAFALVAEVLQLLSMDRTAMPKDAGLNLAGVAAGLSAGVLLRQSWPRRPRDPDPPTA